MTDFHIYVCARTSDANILKRDLTSSSVIARSYVPLTVLWNQKSASGAFAHAMESAAAEFLIFTHCDVYFPERWFERLEWEIERLTKIDRTWAVAGISAISFSGEHVGRIWDTSLEPLTREIYGKALTAPVPIVSTDELAFVVRNGAGHLFDPSLPEFHLYGTDIILNAQQQGMSCYGLDMPLIHNAKPQLRMGSDYVKSYNYMKRKWRDRLPIPTTCGTLNDNLFTIPFRRSRMWYKSAFRKSTYRDSRLLDPSAKARELGLDQLLAARIDDCRE